MVVGGPLRSAMGRRVPGWLRCRKSGRPTSCTEGGPAGAAAPDQDGRRHRQGGAGRGGGWTAGRAGRVRGSKPYATFRPAHGIKEVSGSREGGVGGAEPRMRAVTVGGVARATPPGEPNQQQVARILYCVHLVRMRFDVLESNSGICCTAVTASHEKSFDPRGARASIPGWNRTSLRYGIPPIARLPARPAMGRFGWPASV